LIVASAPIINLNAPSLSLARFSNNGSNILIGFDIPTDGGSIDTYNFKCSRMFTFLGSNESDCHWDNNDNMTVIVENLNDNSVVPGMYLSINTNTNIYAQCPLSNDDTTGSITNRNRCTSARSSSSPVLVLPPVSMDLPVLAVSAPSVLGDCQSYRYRHNYLILNYYNHNNYYH